MSVEDGRYRRGSEIARGGMGRVVEAEDAVLGRTVALKETLEVDDDARRRFEREVRITARLEHPSIVPVYDAGRSAGGLPFYVMRRLTGRPLDQIIHAAATLDERLTYVPAMIAVLDAVGHAHRRGIIHRDLKPANVLIGELGETVVIDWGLAKVLGEIEPAATTAVATAAAGTRPLPALGDALTDRTVAGTVVGTPGFMPPEQAIGDDVDARSDVYALGATLYHLLAGEPPYAGTRPTEILDRTVSEPPPSLAARVPGVPPDLVTIVDKAMAAAPAARYRDAAAMGDDLRRFVSGQLVAAHHYSSRERLIRYVRRNRTTLGVLALAVIALAAVATLSLRRILADRDRIATARAAAEAGRTEAERKSAELRRLADGLILDQARSDLGVDPTLAVAQLTRLAADSPRWPEARAIVAEARSRGITYALPGHAGTTFLLELAPDHRRVLSAGAGDHLVRVHDLEARTSTTIDRDFDPTADVIRWWGDDLIRYDRATHRLDVLDAGTGAVVDTISTAAAWADTSYSAALAWVETDGAIKLRRARGAAVEAVGALAGAAWVGISPQGTFVVAEGPRHHLAMFQRDGAGWVARAGLDTEWSVRFAFDDSAYAYGVDGALVEVDVRATPPVVTRYPTADLVTMFGYTGRTLWSARVAHGQIQVVAHDRERHRAPGMVRLRAVSGFGVGISDGLLAFAGTADDGEVVLARPGGHPLELHAGDVVHRIAARPNTRFLVGAAGNKLLVWDLGEILPDTIDTQIAMSLLYPAGEHMMLGTDSGSWWAIDTRTGRGHEHRLPAQHGYYVLFDAGTLIHYLVDDAIEVIDVATWDTRRLATTATHAMPIRPDRVAAAEADGTVHAIRYDTGASTPLGQLGAPPEAAGQRGGVAYFVGGNHALCTDGTTTETAALPAHVDGGDITDDGTVYLAVDNVVFRWPRGAAAPAALIAPALELASLIAIGPDDLVALAGDRSMWRLDSKTGEVGQILPALDSPPQVSRDHRCAVAVRAGRAVIADLVGRTWWQLPSTGITNAAPGATCDTIYTTGTGTELGVWNVRVPYGDAVRTWVEQRTNARPSDSHGVIEWALPPS